MMKRMYLFVLLVSLVQTAWAEDIWVAASVYDGRNNGVNEYNGRINRETLDALIQKADEEAMFKLSEVFWLSDEGKPVRMSEAKKYGHVYGYTNTIYFKQSAVVRLIELDHQFVSRLLGTVPKE